MDLQPIFKTESVVHALLNGHHQLTTSEIDQLADFFSLPQDLFLDATPASAKNGTLVSAMYLPATSQESMVALGS